MQPDPDVGVQTPFWANNHSDMYVRVLQDELQFPEDRAMDQDTKSLIRGVSFLFLKCMTRFTYLCSCSNGIPHSEYVSLASNGTHISL